MHDIDRTLREQEFGNELEFGQELGQEYEQGYGLEVGQETGYEFGSEFMQELIQEFSPEMEYEYQGEAQANLELELTNELLEVSNEQELNQFVGNLMRKAARAAPGFVQSPTGQSVGRFLMNFGRKTLPHLTEKSGGMLAGAIINQLGNKSGNWADAAMARPSADALGRTYGRRAGVTIGNWVASKAQKIFNLESEGISAEDMEYEIARSYVQFASEVARRASAAVRNNPGISLAQLSRSVLPQAAQQYAPGLLRIKTMGANGVGTLIGRRRKGTWVRRGRSIILYEY